MKKIMVKCMCLLRNIVKLPWLLCHALTHFHFALLFKQIVLPNDDNTTTTMTHGWHTHTHTAAAHPQQKIPMANGILLCCLPVRLVWETLRKKKKNVRAGQSKFEWERMVTYWNGYIQAPYQSAAFNWKFRLSVLQNCM